MNIGSRIYCAIQRGRGRQQKSCLVRQIGQALQPYKSCEFVMQVLFILLADDVNVVGGPG